MQEEREAPVDALAARDEAESEEDEHLGDAASGRGCLGGSYLK